MSWVQNDESNDNMITLYIGKLFYLPIYHTFQTIKHII